MPPRPLSSAVSAQGAGARSRKGAAVVFAVAGLVALGISAYYGRQRYLREHPPPLPNVIAPIPDNLRQTMVVGLNFLGAALHTTTDQQAQLNAIWNPIPRSLDEVIDRQRRTERILTPDQLKGFNRARLGFQNRIIDQMISPARQRMTPDDYAKFEKEVKQRVNQRMDNPL